MADDDARPVSIPKVNGPVACVRYTIEPPKSNPAPQVSKPKPKGGPKKMVRQPNMGESDVTLVFTAAVDSEPARQPDEEVDSLDYYFIEGGVEITPQPPRRVPDAVPNGTPVEMLSWTDREKFWPNSGHKAIFLDYDGTLREFEMRPELATPTREIMDILNLINAKDHLTPHLISGRDVEFLQTNFGELSAFTLIAEHGYQIRRPGCDWEPWENHGMDHESWKKHFKPEMEQLVAEIPNSHLEEKASCLVFHYREVADELHEATERKAHDRLQQLKETHSSQNVFVYIGQKIIEVSSPNVRKGLVMRRVCEEKALFGEPFAGVLVAGDDISDESMFVNAPADFLTIKVGAGETTARFRAGSPAQMRQFLRELFE